MRALPLLALLLLLSGCMDTPAPEPASGDWRPLPCDPQPRDHLPVNARLVPALQGNVTEVAQRVAAALGQAPAVLNRTQSLDGITVGNGTEAPGDIRFLDGSLRWDTPDGVLTHQDIVYAGPLAADGIDLSRVFQTPRNASANSTWVLNAVAPGLPNEAEATAEVLALFSALGAEPERLRVDFWRSNQTWRPESSEQAMVRVQQWVGNHTTYGTHWFWDLDHGGNATMRKTVAALYAFDDVAWLGKEALLERLRAFTACTLEGTGVDPEGLEYSLMDAFVANGTVVVEAEVRWPHEADCMYPVLSTYLDAQWGLVYQAPRDFSTECTPVSTWDGTFDRD